MGYNKHKSFHSVQGHAVFTVPLFPMQEAQARNVYLLVPDSSSEGTSCPCATSARVLDRRPRYSASSSKAAGWAFKKKKKNLNNFHCVSLLGNIFLLHISDVPTLSPVPCKADSKQHHLKVYMTLRCRILYFWCLLLFYWLLYRYIYRLEHL